MAEVRLDTTDFDLLTYKKSGTTVQKWYNDGRHASNTKLSMNAKNYIVKI